MNTKKSLQPQRQSRANPLLALSAMVAAMACSQTEFASNKGVPKASNQVVEQPISEIVAEETPAPEPTPELVVEDPLPFEVIPVVEPTEVPEVVEVVIIPSPTPSPTPRPVVTVSPGPVFGREDDGVQRGLVGNVYKLSDNTERLPDFSVLQPVNVLVLPNLNITNRSFTEGFPGVQDLIEYFGIQFRGTLKVPESGTYSLRITSDDGSKLYLDGAQVIDNDGKHAVQARETSLFLSQGNHKIRLEYFQGPKYNIALQFHWRKPGSSVWEVVPPIVLDRPEGE